MAHAHCLRSGRRHVPPMPPPGVGRCSRRSKASCRAPGLKFSVMETSGCEWPSSDPSRSRVRADRAATRSKCGCPMVSMYQSCRRTTRFKPARTLRIRSWIGTGRHSPIYLRFMIEILFGTPPPDPGIRFCACSDTISAPRSRWSHLPPASHAGLASAPADRIR